MDNKIESIDIKTRNIIEENYINHLKMLSYLYDFASEFLKSKLGDEYKLPIPIRTVVERFSSLIFESAMANEKIMERDSLGAFNTLTASTIHIKLARDKETLKVIKGEDRKSASIKIDANLGENAKRYYIAHELARSLLIARHEMAPVTKFPITRGPFSLLESMNELIVSSLAKALIMPYDLIIEEKKKYEVEHHWNPLSYMEWINHLEVLVRVPQYILINGYDEIRKIELLRRMTEEEPKDINILKKEL